MRRRFIIAAIVVVALGAPIAEAFDGWDHGDEGGNDTEANMVIAALCIGTAFAVGTTMVVSAVAAAAAARFPELPQVPDSPSISAFAPSTLNPSISPPLALRI